MITFSITFHISEYFSSKHPRRDMKRSLLAFLILPFLLTAFSRPPAAAASSLEGRLTAFYAADLDYGYFLPRIHASAGLGHLGSTAAGKVARIQELAREGSGLESLVALWALARIGTPEALAMAEARAAGEEERLLQGAPAEQAARVAFLAALPGGQTGRADLDRALPRLYNVARKGRESDKLLSVWALCEIGTPITIEVANEALRSVAARIDPGHGYFTRHSTFLRLIGPPAGKYLADRLVDIIRHHDFSADLFAKRAQTVLTLALVASPEHPGVAAFRQELPLRLATRIDRSQALADMLALGPFACSSGTIAELQEIVGARDRSDREEARMGLQNCEGFRWH